MLYLYAYRNFIECITTNIVLKAISTMEHFLMEHFLNLTFSPVASVISSKLYGQLVQ